MKHEAQVFLRNNKPSLVHGVVAEKPYRFFGYIDEVEPSVWMESGAWLETGEPHAKDIISVVTPDGAIVPFKK